MTTIPNTLQAFITPHSGPAYFAIFLISLYHLFRKAAEELQREGPADNRPGLFNCLVK